jgi:hypothetical protein
MLATCPTQSSPGILRLVIVIRAYVNIIRCCIPI